MKNSSVKISYWVVPEAGEKMVDIVGIDAFTKSISKDYIAVVQPKRGDLGGGLYELTVEFVTSISLIEVAKFIGGGIAYDLIKSGADSFILRPFLQAYKTLKETSIDRHIDTYQLKINFLECELIITKITTDSVFDQLENILHTFSAHYKNLQLPSGALPYQIHIPIFEDTSEDRITRFRYRLDVDENIEQITNDAYFEYWGLVYNNEIAIRIYDVGRRLLIDQEFLTQEQYWQQWEIKFAKNT